MPTFSGSKYELTFANTEGTARVWPSLVIGDAPASGGGLERFMKCDVDIGVEGMVTWPLERNFEVKVGIE